MNPAPHWQSHTTKLAFEQMDRWRRQRGSMLDAAGFGPVQTSHRVVHAQRGVTLRAYADGDAGGPAMLIVPAPIKRPYIWDLAPPVSVVRKCLDRGLRVYLAHWERPDDDGHSHGLDDYGDRMLARCADAIEADCRERDMVVAGHSLGGVLATTFACLYPRRIRALVLLESPLHFGAHAGNFAPMVASVGDTQSFEALFGNVPGSLLNTLSAIAAPEAFHWERFLDLSMSLTDSDALTSHMRVERWTHDESPLPGRLFADIIERLYRDDQLMRGTLRIGQRQIGPQDVAAPLLNVIAPRSKVIPPQSILPFHDATASTSKKVLTYEGDVGVAIQHVGVLVGARAHATLWPAIFDWLAQERLVH